jgi:glycosyltransferase involved in cell wall biosynthesis
VLKKAHTVRPLVLVSGLAPGGAERVVVSLLVRLQRGGLSTPICTVTSRHDGPLAAELTGGGVDRRDLGARRLADPRALVRLVRLLRSKRFDLIHAHGQDATILGAAAARVRRTRLVITRHVLEEPGDGWRQRARAGLTLRAFRSADTPVAVSRAAAQRLSRLARLPAEAIRVLPNGIDVDAYASPDPERARARLCGELSIPGDARLVLLPAVLRPGKGHDTLLEALPALEARSGRVRVLLAGAGELEEELRRKAERHADLLHFLGHRTDMPELMAAADLVILPSQAEALPTVLIEAAAAGRPVVATRVGGVPEVVKDGRTGILVPPGDPVALAEAVTSLLNDPERRSAFGERAARVARDRFSLDRQAERTVALWEDTIRGGSS